MMNSYGRGGRTSGRGGRGRGRNPGRGRGRFGGRTNTSKPQEREVKFAPIQSQGRSTVATYAATTKDAVIQLIEKTYRGGADVGKSLDDMIKVDLSSEAPTRVLFQATDADTKLVDQAGLDMDYYHNATRREHPRRMH
jgi:hypothetical protein